MKKITILTCSILLLPFVVGAQSYTPLVTIPLGDSSDFDGYINAIYALSISLAALLAVIKIIIAGVKWMTTEIIVSKGEAKKDIQGALLGLLLILSAVLIISIINPDIGDVDLQFNNIDAPSQPIAQTQSEIEQQYFAACAQAATCEAIACSGSDVHGFDCTIAESACSTRGGTPNENQVESAVLCINSFGDLVDETGSGIFPEENVIFASVLPNESAPAAYNRVLDEQISEGKELVYRIGTAGFTGGQVEQRKIEQACSDAGGTGVVYITSPQRNFVGGMCLK